MNTIREYGVNGLLAQIAQPSGNPTGDMIKFVGMMGVMVIIFYVLIIGPQRKRTKELDNLLKGLKAGDKVVTNSGIIGVVLSIKERTVAIRSADTKLEILKSSVAEVTDRGGETAEAKN